MGETTKTTKGHSGPAIGAAVLGAAWIGLTIWARWSAGQTHPEVVPPLAGPSAIALGISLLAVMLLLWAALTAGRSAAGVPGAVAMLAYAGFAAGLIAAAQVDAWDAASAALALGAIWWCLQSGPGWSAGALCGLACAGSPLAAGAVAGGLFAGRTVGRTFPFLVASVAIAAAATLGLQLLAARSWGAAWAVSSDLGRMGPAFLWMQAAWWLDLCMPAVVLACLAAAKRLFDQETVSAELSARNQLERWAMVWLALAFLAAVVMPRVLVEHGLLFSLPVFLLVPAGWRVMGDLPFGHSNWSLSFFCAACYVLLLVLMLAPISKAGGVILVGVLG